MSGAPRVAPELDKPGLQTERTALAWERTAISKMVVGVLLARAAAGDAHWITALAGLAQTFVGAAVLVWAGLHYHQLHGPIQRGDGVVHPGAARAVGIATIAVTGVSLLLAAIIIAEGSSG